MVTIASNAPFVLSVWRQPPSRSPRPRTQPFDSAALAATLRANGGFHLPLDSGAEAATLGANGGFHLPLDSGADPATLWANGFTG